MLRLHSFALVLAAISGGVSAATVSTSLNIVNRQIAPDGFTRITTLPNGTFPGPIIRAKKGDRLQIKVADELNDSSLDLVTSIHWHGIFQKHTNYYDGTASVTQCPIVPNESFTYDFTIPEQYGTYWYHSHFSDQYCDGLRGALIIDDPNDPQKHLYDFDNDATVITLGDWYHYLSTNAPPIPAFNSTLINGLGRYPDGPPTPLAVVNVQHGKRYRFRLVSISCDPGFVFSIDSHNLTVIEVEGTNTQPLLIDSLLILAGQRYSVVLDACLPVDNYWIRALPNGSSSVGRNFGNLNNLAILRYAGAPPVNPAQDPTVNIPVSQIPLVENNLHPLVPSPVPGSPEPGGADININLNVSNNDFAFLINGVNFVPPTVPVLLQILSGANVSQLVPAGSIYGLGLNKSVELTIPSNAVGGPHPVHLHGHNFHVVRSAGSASYNFDNPIVRDVVNLGNTGDLVTIRFLTDNPGPWFFHCHIDWHLKAGFAVVFAEDVPDIPKVDAPPAAWGRLCPAYNSFVNGTS